MKCPFKREIEKGTMVCDYGGQNYSDSPEVQQCPTEIFNKCQEEGSRE